MPSPNTYTRISQLYRVAADVARFQEVCARLFAAPKLVRALHRRVGAHPSDGMMGLTRVADQKPADDDA
jgi:hypothetical protein